MTYVTLAHGSIHVREIGAGEPLLILHGGWGYEFYPFDHAIAELSASHRLVIPDRTGYGRSPRIAALPARFHEAAALESERVLDALHITRCAIWGHSDGAVIAAIMALRDPERISGIVLEALHLSREKPRSRAFFTMMAEDPDGFGPRVTDKLAREHGDGWREVLRAGGRAWLAIAATPVDDFYDHRLGELRVPTLVIHGVDDPRTEPGELDRITREVPDATIAWITGGQHSPHSERRTAAEVTRVVARFLESLAWKQT
ncbi:MAG: alpha/beta hydrolase [Kofleriaceae bacterium]